MKTAFVLAILFVYANTETKNCWLKPYSRGVGKPLHACPKGKENNASICYTPCKSGYKGASNWCHSPKAKSYARDNGKPLQCTDKEQQQAGLCYIPCKANHNGVGPVCWAKCPPSMHTCGALCTPTADDCTAFVKQTVTNATAMFVNLAKSVTGTLDVVGTIKSAGKTASDLAVSTCGKRRMFTIVHN